MSGRPPPSRLPSEPVARQFFPPARGRSNLSSRQRSAQLCRLPARRPAQPRRSLISSASCPPASAPVHGQVRRPVAPAPLCQKPPPLPRPRRSLIPPPTSSALHPVRVAAASVPLPAQPACSATHRREYKRPSSQQSARQLSPLQNRAGIPPA